MYMDLIRHTYCLLQLGDLVIEKRLVKNKKENLVLTLKYCNL